MPSTKHVQNGIIIQTHRRAWQASEPASQAVSQPNTQPIYLGKISENPSNSIGKTQICVGKPLKTRSKWNNDTNASQSSASQQCLKVRSTALEKHRFASESHVKTRSKWNNHTNTSQSSASQRCLKIRSTALEKHKFASESHVKTRSKWNIAELRQPASQAASQPNTQPIYLAKISENPSNSLGKRQICVGKPCENRFKME